MKVFVLAPAEDWICDRLVNEWYENFSDYSTKNIQQADIIWLLAGWCWNHIPLDVLKNKKVIVSEHHFVPEKFSSEKYQNFMLRDSFVDAYHVPNEKTENFLRQITKKPIYNISYWLNDKLWKPSDKIAARKKLGIDENNFCIGSFQRDTEGFDLITPKLEKGPDIFCDVVGALNKHIDNIHVILGGWRRQYVQHRLEENGIKYSLFEKSDLSKIQFMYAASDLYVVSSRYEGGPQAIIEAAAMKIPILSTDVGIASKVLSKNCITDFKSFKIPIEEVNYNYDSVQKLSISSIGNEYLKMMDEVTYEQ